MKSAFIGLIGRPSTGKSSLLNIVCGNKVSIVSPFPQTTRNRVRGIYTDKRGQLIFIDTPGYHNSEKKFNSFLKDLVLAAMKEVDLILYLLDVTRPPGEEEQILVSLVKGFPKKLIIGLNKTDINPNHLSRLKDLLEKELIDVPMVEISCKLRFGIDSLLSILWEKAPPGELYYPENIYTDQTPEFRVSEIIREKVILNTRKEIPHAVYIEISDMEMRPEKNSLWVRGFICVERESQKGILIGRQGNLIKKIIKEVLEESSALFPYKLILDLTVKVRSKWKKDDNLLKKLIF
jgi:GTP-binding protein Era